MCLTSFGKQQYIKKRTAYKVLNVGRNDNGLFYTSYYQESPVKLGKFTAKLGIHRDYCSTIVEEGLHAYTCFHKAKMTATRHRPQYPDGYTIIIKVTVWGRGYLGRNNDIVTPNMEYTSFEPVFIYDPYRHA